MKVIVHNDVFEHAWHVWDPSKRKSAIQFGNYIKENYGLNVNAAILKDGWNWEVEIIDEKLATLFLLRWS